MVALTAAKKMSYAYNFLVFSSSFFVVVVVAGFLFFVVSFSFLFNLNYSRTEETRLNEYIYI